MCFDHVIRESFGGGLAVLSPCLPKLDASGVHLSGRLVFHDQGKGSLIATHAMFTADPSDASHFNGMAESCIVRIHETGDLTKPAKTSPLWATFSLQPVASTSKRDTWRSVEIELERPVKIEVGADGIIGRRVSVWTQQGAGPLAEGIIGYN